MVPATLVEKVKAELPEWAGLMFSSDGIARVVAPAPVNTQSRKLSVKECARLVEILGNQIVSTERKLYALHGGFINGRSDYGCEYHI